MWIVIQLRNAINSAYDHRNETPWPSFGGPLRPKLLLVILGSFRITFISFAIVLSFHLKQASQLTFWIYLLSWFLFERFLILWQVLLRIIRLRRLRFKIKLFALRIILYWNAHLTLFLLIFFIETTLNGTLTLWELFDCWKLLDFYFIGEVINFCSVRDLFILHLLSVIFGL